MESVSPKVFDCFLYSGEEDVLEIRFNELWDTVDCFVIVEATRTFSDLPRELSWNPNSNRFAKFASKVRHVVVRDLPDGNNPWEREAFQRNSVLRGIADARDDDLIVMSDADEIPRASTIRLILKNSEADTFGLEMAFFYFYVNYRNVSGPEASLTWSVVAKRQVLDQTSPDELRYRVRNRTIPCQHVPDAGWHFSYLSDLAGIRKKISSFSHQELNTEDILEKIDLEKIVSNRRDLFNRVGFVWDVVDRANLPTFFSENRTTMSHLFYPKETQGIFRPFLSRLLASRSVKRQPPVIICPYVHDKDEIAVKRNFFLDAWRSRNLQFHLWKDEMLIGPEQAFQHCWDQYPGRDIIIIHPDMTPMPSDKRNIWYDKLLSYRDQLDDAGFIASNLYFPEFKGGGVQCAGERSLRARSAT